MNTNNILPPVRVLFSESWSMFKDKFVALFKITLISLVAGILFQSMIDTSPEPKIRLSIVLIMFLVLIIINLIVQAAQAYAIAEPITASEALKKSPRKAWPLFWTGLIYGIIVLIGLVLFIVPGIIFLVRYGFYIFTVTLENLSGMAALRKSKEYVSGHTWEVFWKGLVFGIILCLVYAPAWALQNQSHLMANIYNAVVSIFASPFAVAYSYAMYKHLHQAFVNR